MYLQNREENSVDPDQLASEKPADLDLIFVMVRLKKLFQYLVLQVLTGH